MASKVQKVIGIEICKEAVEDAKENAHLNSKYIHLSSYTIYSSHTY
jgi:tRNA/tmRNA/rRNA uracil-C5-methylase (TrmA/RlmC/RlmD family)